MPRLVRGQAANKAQNQFSVDVETLIVMISHYWEMIIWRSANTARRLLEGKQTAVDKSRKGELFVEESDVLVWLERERRGSSCITWIQSLKIHNILLSRGRPTHWRTEMCVVTFFSWCRLGKNLKNNNKNTLQWSLSDTTTAQHTLHELLSVLISFQCSWECPESVWPLLPTPSHRETLSLWNHTKDAVSVCVGVSTVD